MLGVPVVDKLRNLPMSRPWFQHLACGYFSAVPDASVWSFLSQFMQSVAAGGKMSVSREFLIGQVGQLLDAMYGEF